ncbi:DUF1405 domain-containing protein [Calditerricola yamamurae]|jgi:Predicted membrane protein|nr:DUF1405 domain-containing protein [Bacillota bacterium]
MGLRQGDWRMWWPALAARRDVMAFLVGVNFLGTLYGYYWYREQLAATPVALWPFVPDSPTASAAFTLVLAMALAGRANGWVHAFAAVTMVKYGIWAPAVILTTGALGGPIPWQNWMLVASHLAMALEALLYAFLYRIKGYQWWGVAAWTLLNDAVDYGLDVHPWMGPTLEPYDHLVGWATVGLSLLSIVLARSVAAAWSGERGREN